MSFNFSVTTNAVFGNGKISELRSFINTPNAPVAGRKALVVISNGKSMRANGYLDRVLHELNLANSEYVVFDEVSSNPTKREAEAGGRIAADNNCYFIVALGGGSVIDAAKAIGIVAANESDDLWEYVMFGTGKKRQPENASLPIIAIPTTAGTGSETDGGAVITNTDTNEKTGVFGKGTMPKLAIIDPELMMSVPPKFKAYQGFVALFHSTEGFISNKRNEMSKTVASEAIRNVSANLAKAVNDPKDNDAISKVAFGSYLSGIQMTVGSCTSAHPLEHALSAMHPNLPHGAGLIMISTAFYETFIEKHVCDDRFIEMARLMGIKNASEPAEFITALESLKTACGVDDLRMSDFGISPNEFVGMVQNARDTLWTNFQNDPVPLTDEECLKIYQKSYK